MVKAEMTTYARTKLIRGKAYVFITRDNEKGGGKMKEKTEIQEEMVFVNINEIPQKMGKRAEITNKLLELFAKIPMGKAWKINVTDSTYKFGTIKVAVAKINVNIKDLLLHYRCTQRKEGVDTFVYVIHGD